MGEIVNLRRARKARARVDAGTAAAANRAKSGRTKAERDKAALVQTLHQRQLDAHLLVKPDGDAG